MPIIPVSLGQRSNPGRDGQDGAARLINCYAEEMGQEGKIPWPVYASDGLVDFVTLAATGSSFTGRLDFSVNTNSQYFGLLGGFV